MRKAYWEGALPSAGVLLGRVGGWLHSFPQVIRDHPIGGQRNPTPVGGPSDHMSSDGRGEQQKTQSQQRLQADGRVSVLDRGGEKNTTSPERGGFRGGMHPAQHIGKPDETNGAGREKESPDQNQDPRNDVSQRYSPS